MSLSRASGLVFSERAGGVCACHPGLPAGQVWGKYVGHGASKEALSRCSPPGPAEGASYQAGGNAGSQRPVSLI